eukprot:TRINITY_DN15271_c0_g1_i1.p1 TRINITY_DN15271_c0_g1~~TRINITY_DN15271_c0_g1_i1.p1  ORF type:complete len:250 (+),score=32.84 TRINITY_DN15271_c0_g1_i1:88-837(+)
MFQSLDHECYLTEELLEVFDLSSQQPYYLTKDLLEAFQRSIGAATGSREGVRLSNLRTRLNLHENAMQADDAFKLASHLWDFIDDPLGEAPEGNDGIKDDASDSSSTIVLVGGMNLGRALEVVSTCDSLPMGAGEQPSDYLKNDCDVRRGCSKLRGVEPGNQWVQGPPMGLIGWTRRCTPESSCHELVDSLKYRIQGPPIGLVGRTRRCAPECPCHELADCLTSTSCTEGLLGLPRGQSSCARRFPQLL